MVICGYDRVLADCFWIILSNLFCWYNMTMIYQWRHDVGARLLLLFDRPVWHHFWGEIVKLLTFPYTFTKLLNYLCYYYYDSTSI